MDSSPILRWTLALLFPIVALSSLSLLLFFFVSDSSSVPVPLSLSSQCRIVSSSVDLKSAKVCELGLLNYKAKNVFYPLEGGSLGVITITIGLRFLRYTFLSMVEYRDLSSGQTRVAPAEAPSEALPLSCRPNFGAAWFTKDKFKVNKTYDCWYRYGVSQVSLFEDGFFSCQAKDPSTFEMIRRYLFLSTKILQSWYLSHDKAMFLRWEILTGLVSGFVTALISVIVIRLMQLMKSQLHQISVVRMLSQLVSGVLFRRTCFLMAYISFMGWLTIEYGKRLGLPELLSLLKE